MCVRVRTAAEKSTEHKVRAVEQAPPTANWFTGGRAAQLTEGGACCQRLLPGSISCDSPTLWELHSAHFCQPAGRAGDCHMTLTRHVLYVWLQGVEWEAGPQVKMSVMVDTEQNLRQQEMKQERGETRQQERGGDKVSSEGAGPSQTSAH